MRRQLYPKAKSLRYSLYGRLVGLTVGVGEVAKRKISFAPLPRIEAQSFSL
jgi:hypothetical protein